MVAARHEISWLAPSTVWHGRLKTTNPVNGSLSGPAILRFNSDDFMDQFLTVAAYQPERMGEWLAQPETWHEPMKTPELSTLTRKNEPVSQRRQDLLKKSELSVTTLPAIVPPPTDSVFKLYQPAQQRFYLATASLVCKERGLPDRKVDTGKQEQVGFVLRRIVPPVTLTGDGDPNSSLAREYAFVATNDGPRWQEIEPDQRERIVDNEERNPMFSVTYRDSDRQRRLFAGLIPVAKREAYVGAARNELNPTDTTGEPFAERDPRRLLFEARVTEPWRSLVETATATALKVTDDYADNPIPIESPPSAAEDNQRRALLLARRNSIQTISWLVLLDMALFLEKYIEAVWDELNGITPATPLTDSQQQLVDTIVNTDATNVIAEFKANGAHSAYSSLNFSLKDALITVRGDENVLEAVEYQLALNTHPATPLDPDDPNQDWPGFLFPLANPPVDNNGSPLGGESDLVPLLPDSSLEPIAPAGPDISDRIFAKLEALAALVEKALPDDDQPKPELTMPQLEAWDNREPWFVLRCVYDRPNCFPFESAVVSKRSQAFQIASFFDSDAPARPIRIPMPLDISPAGLRKYKRNTTLMMSDMLCGQVGRIKKITLADLVLSVLPWPFHKDLPKVGPATGCKSGGNSFGMFCSLSIPIVTLCAMILLIIIVALFDMFFKWIPFLFTCFPIPGLKGKKQNV